MVLKQRLRPALIAASGLFFLLIQVGPALAQLATDQAPFGVSVVSPSNGANVSGSSVILTAQTSRAASSIGFNISGANLQAIASDPTATIWSAAWDTTRSPDGSYRIVASAISSDGSAASGSVDVTVSNQTQPRSPAATIFSPASGASVSGSAVPLNAQTSVASSQLSFVISGGGPSVTVQAVGDAGGMSWSASWNSTSFLDGQYSVLAQAAAAGTASPASFSSPTVVFSVDNPDPFTTLISAPTSGQIISGHASFTATTSTVGTELSFVISGGSLAAPSLFVAAPDSAATTWNATWDTGTLANGTYSARAKARRSDGFEVFSPSVGFSINNAAEPAFTAGIDSPAPASSVVGIVEIKASTSLAASSVSFRMTGGPNNISSTFLAVPDAAKTRWAAQWDSKTAVNGTYSLTALATRTSGTGASSTVQSATITVAVNNPEAPPMAVTIVEPAPTASLKETVRFGATTSVAADSLVFLVRGANAVAVATIAAVPDAAKTGWSALWDTKAVVSGTYTFIARASKAGIAVEDGPRTIAVNNISSQPTTLTATMVSPQSAASISGTIEVKVSTDGAADGVQVFYRSSDANSAPVTLSAAGDTEKKIWTAAWDTTKIANGTYSLYARAVKGNLSATTTAVTAAVNNSGETALAVTLSAPVSGAALAGVAQLKAATSLVSDTVKFSVTSASGSSIVIDGLPDSTGKIWSASWNSSDAVDGTYLVKAGATRGANKAESASVNVTVAGKAEAAVKLAVAIHEPAQRSVASGTVIFKIATTTAADQVTITVIAAATSSIVTKFGATADASRTAWTGAWDSTRSPDAAYRISALAVKSGSSAEVAVALDVKNQQLTPTSTVPPTEEKRVLWVVVSHPPAASELRGNVTLAAKTAGGATKVMFVINAAGATQPIQTKEASWSVADSAWGAIWDTSRHTDGSYIIVGIALDSAGKRAQSDAVAVRTANAVKEGPTVAAGPVVVIPREVIIDSVKEVPEGTKPLLDEGTPETDSLNDRSQEKTGMLGLDPECAAAGVSGDKCEEFLSFRHRSDECHEAGIITKEECVNYLSLRGGGRLSECSALTRDECDALIGKKTAGLLSTERLEKLEDALISRIGRVVRFGPAELVIDGGAEEVTEEEKLIIENVPLVTRRELSLRVHASPSYGEADGLSFKQVAAVLMIDSDGDGLPDDTEGRLKTDPNDADSDDDGYSDWTEVKNGYNPLGDGKLGDDTEYAPIDRAIVAGSPLEQPKTGGETDTDLKIDDVIIGEDPDAPVTRFEGKAEPGTTVTIYVYSYLPIVLTATADENGNWSYELDSSLGDGGHEAYVTVTDDTGKIQKKSNPLAFFVAEAKAAQPSGYFGDQAVNSVQVQAPVQRVFQWYGFAAAGLILFALIVVGLIMLRKMKKTGA